MPSFSGRIDLTAPPDVVFPYLHEEAKLKRWVTGYVENIPQSLGEFGVNSRSIDVVEESGKRMEMETIIREYAAPTRLVFDSGNDHVATTTTFDLQATDSGSTLSMALEANAKGLFASMKSLFISSLINQRSQQNLEQLQQIIREDTQS